MNASTKKVYLLKALVSPALAKQVQKRAKEIDTSLAEFIRDALAYYLLAFQEADKGYSPAFIDSDGNLVRVSDSKIETMKGRVLQPGRTSKSDSQIVVGAR